MVHSAASARSNPRLPGFLEQQAAGCTAWRREPTSFRAPYREGWAPLRREPGLLPVKGKGSRFLKKRLAQGTGLGTRGSECMADKKCDRGAHGVEALALHVTEPNSKPPV